MSFTVRLSRAAANKLARVDRLTQGRILQRLGELEADPYDPHAGKPLVHAAGRWSARVIKHARYYWLLLAEGHPTRRLFGAMVRRIEAFPGPP